MPPSTAPAPAAARTDARSRWNRSVDEVAASRPAVTSRLSPGRKKPRSRPVSAKSTRKTPSAPKECSKSVALSGLSASVLIGGCSSDAEPDETRETGDEAVDPEGAEGPILEISREEPHREVGGDARHDTAQNYLAA